MKKLSSILFILLYCAAFIKSAQAAAPVISGPDMEITDNTIIVKTSITGASDLEQEIKTGVGKEIIFTAEIIRAWKFWPDEFVVSKKIRKIVKYDNLRDRYRAFLRDGTMRSENIYNDFTALKEWMFTSDPVNLANIKELEPGTYYIRTVVESKSREKPPLIGFLMHLVPEMEMSLTKESRTFAVGTAEK